MRYGAAFGAVVMVATSAALTVPSVASACGGCFAPPETIQVVTDHRMAMAIHEGESVLWDQIRYTGRPEDFSWILPVQGEVRIELASDEFFTRLESATAVTVVPPPLPSPNCPFFRSADAPSAAEGNSADAGTGVQVIRQEVVGPYNTVVVRSEDPDALARWLRTNGYAIPPAIEPVIQYYTDRRMDFVALRLQPNEGVDAMQPVRIRYATANTVLPLRMVAAGVGDKVGITLWVFGHGRFEAQNFRNGEIAASDLVWDWDRNRSNYGEVFRTTLDRLDGGRAWITESASEARPYRHQFQYDSDGGWARPGPGDAGVEDGGAGQTTVRDDWSIATNNDAANVWITRMRTDLLARFLDADLSLQAAARDIPVSNRLRVQSGNEIGTRPAPRCPGDVGGSGSGASSTSGSASPFMASRCNAGPAPGRGAVPVAGLAAGLLGLALAWRRRR